MKINPQFYFKAKPIDWKTNPANDHYVCGFYHAVTDNYTPKNMHTLTLFTENQKGEIILTDAVNIDIDTMLRCTGCYDTKNELLWEKDIVYDKDDNTLTGTVTFENGTLPCVEFVKKPTYDCTVLNEDKKSHTTTVLLTKNVCKRLISCENLPKKSFINSLIELLKQDYDENTLINEINHLMKPKVNTKDIFANMPCKINDKIYASEGGYIPIGKVINFMIDKDNIRYIEVETKYGTTLYTETEFKDMITPTQSVKPTHTIPIF